MGKISDAARPKSKMPRQPAPWPLRCSAQQFIVPYDTVSMNVEISTLVVDLDTILTGVPTAIAVYTRFLVQSGVLFAVPVLRRTRTGELQNRGRR